MSVKNKLKIVIPAVICYMTAYIEYETNESHLRGFNQIF